MAIKIFIDPGHGGTDPGAVGNKMKEKDVNLDVALKLKTILKSKGFLVKMSRETDVSMELGERCRIANQWGADYGVSVHHNAGGGDGAEVIHSIYKGKGDALANNIVANFKAIGQNLHGDGIVTKEGKDGDYFALIRDTHMPTVITEFAFIDSKDAQAIDSDADRMKEATAIAKGICATAGVRF